MADIELTVKIDADVYTRIFDNGIQDYEIATDDICEMARSLRRGTPIPKGHGRLLDVGQCDRELFYQQCGGADALITVKSAFDMLMSLPTIVEADTESEV